MFPMGHVAFAYLVHWRITGRTISIGAFVALAVAAVTPTVADEALQYWSVFGLHHLWAHSLVVPALLWAGWWATRATLKRGRVLAWLFAFALGYSTHLLSEPVFDMLHLVFSVRTDDVGTSWLFPFYNLVVRGPEFEPGFYLVWWQVGLEALALSLALWHWLRQWMKDRSSVATRQ